MGYFRATLEGSLFGKKVIAVHLLSLISVHFSRFYQRSCVLLRSARAYFGFCRSFSGSSLNLLGGEPMPSYGTMPSIKCKSFFGSCYDLLKGFVKATKSFFRSLLQPCFPQCFRYRRNYEQDYLDAVSVVSDESISSSDFCHMHAAFSPARAACRAEVPDPSLDDLDLDSEIDDCNTPLLKHYSSSSDDIDYQQIKRDVRRNSRVVTAALVHKVEACCSDREILV